MAIAAVPKYLGTDFRAASPGLRFGIYLQLWGVNNRTHEALWTMHDINYRVAGRDRQERESKDENKTACLKNACSLTENDKSILAALCLRQKTWASLCDADALLIMDAQSIAPFSTGLGNEHPLENGFAFLNPYGLPYLPGSGVKGVLRQAVWELASGDWGNTWGWKKEACYSLEIERGKPPIRLSMLDVLFGYEGDDGGREHVRGALSFWDVIPRLAGNALAVDIMTPHQSHYYQNGDTPHESGSPNPISFLTVPPQSGFVFYVQCDKTHLKRLAPELAENNRWRTLLKAAFEHAFNWLGFGAKTAVGYGAMSIDKKAYQDREEEMRKEQEAKAKRIREEEEKARLATAPEWQQIRAQVLKEKPVDVKNEDALLKALESNRWPLPDESRRIAEEVAGILKESKQWREKSEKKNPGKDQPYQKTLRVKKYLSLPITPIG
jgi:CRISPR-associated protein Cmr6